MNHIGLLRVRCRLHAAVAVRERDRTGLERLVRYILRPPLAQGRLALRDDGTISPRAGRAGGAG